MATENMTNEQQVRLLRAKASELESLTLIYMTDDPRDQQVPWSVIGSLTADIALVATMLADLIERIPDPNQPGVGG